MKRCSALILAAIACLAAAGLLSASALGLPIPLGSNLPLEVGGKITPSTLSKAIPEPISLTWHGKFSEPLQGTSGFQPLLFLDFDKNITISTKGLSTCTLSAAEKSEQSCPKAIVGHGKVEMRFNFPEKPTFHEKGPVVIYNGAQLGGRGLIFHFLTRGRYPFEWGATGVFHKATGKFGTQTSIKFPPSFYFFGHLTGLQMTIGKTWKYNGKKVGFLSARCPKSALFIHSEYEFATGTKGSGEIVKHCG